MADVVVITGGSAGIGRAAAQQFAARGCAVGIIARGQERLDSARAELEALGARVHTVSADVADADAVERAAAEIEQALGPITVWVNNAMATVYSQISNLDAEEVKRVTEVTYLGAVNGTLAALRRMKQRGTIVQVSSVLSWRAIPIQGAYCGAKFALRGFTESLRAELIHDGSPVHLTMVHLPAINTPQFDWARNKIGRRSKAPDTVYQPEMAARAIVFAAFNRRRDVFLSKATPPDHRGRPLRRPRWWTRPWRAPALTRSLASRRRTRMATCSPRRRATRPHVAGSATRRLIRTRSTAVGRPMPWQQGWCC